MKNRIRDLLLGLSILCLVASRDCSHLSPAFAAPAPIAVKRVAVPMPTGSTLTAVVYTVTNAASFPALPLPANSLVFRNGMLAVSNLDYTIGAAGTTFAFNASSNLATGDLIAVVTFR